MRLPRWGALALVLGAGTARAQSTSAPLYQLSYNLEAKGEVAGALAALQRLDASATQEYVFFLREGWLYYLNARYAEAVTAYGRAVELEPHAVEPHLGASLPLMALRRWDDAEKQCLAVLERAPGEFLAVSRLAYIHYQQGRYPKAEAYYRQAIALYPSNIEMHAGLGWTLLQEGQAGAARQEFEAVLRIAPEFAGAQQGLAQAADGPATRAASAAGPSPAPAPPVVNPR